MSNNQLLWRATNEIGDWFSRLGGSNRYLGMVESEIFLYIVCKTLDTHTNSDFIAEFVDPRIIEYGKDAVRNANNHIGNISATQPELNQLLSEYLNHYDQKVQVTNEASKRWNEFLSKFKLSAV